MSVTQKKPCWLCTINSSLAIKGGSRYLRRPQMHGKKLPAKAEIPEGHLPWLLPAKAAITAWYVPRVLPDRHRERHREPCLTDTVGRD